MRVVCITLLLVVTADLNLTNALTNVLVTGAAGRTGALVFQKLLADSRYNPVGVVRTEKSKKKLVKKMGCDPDNVVCSDILSEEVLTESFKKASASKLVLCTSAVPKIKLWSILKVLIWKLFGKTARPLFRFIEKGDPYHVDYIGAINQFKASKAAGIDQVVVVGSMGGSQPENFLNTIGRKEGDEKSGNILLWKRKAEKFLISLCQGKEADSSSSSSGNSSSMSYTIVHPGGLIDKPGGEREIVFGVDDQLLKEKVRNIPRGDVATVCVEALSQEKAKNRSFDIIAKSPEDTTAPTSDFGAFFATTGDSVYEDET